MATQAFPSIFQHGMRIKFPLWAVNNPNTQAVSKTNYVKISWGLDPGISVHKASWAKTILENLALN